MCQGSDWQSPLTRCTYTVQTEDVELVTGVGICGNLQQLFSGYVTTKKTAWLWKTDWKCCELELGRIVLWPPKAWSKCEVLDLRSQDASALQRRKACPTNVKHLYTEHKCLLSLSSGLLWRSHLINDDGRWKGSNPICTPTQTSTSVPCHDPVSRMIMTSGPLTHKPFEHSTHRCRKKKKKKDHPDTFSYNSVTVEWALWALSWPFEHEVGFWVAGAMKERRGGRGTNTRQRVDFILSSNMEAPCAVCHQQAAINNNTNQDQNGKQTSLSWHRSVPPGCVVIGLLSKHLCR